MPYSPSSYWIGSRLPLMPDLFEVDDQALATMSKLNAERGALIHGVPGTGKTTLLAHFALPYIRMPLPSVTKRLRAPWLDRTALWSSMSEYVEDIQSEFRLEKRWEDWGEHASASGIARSTPMLFLDDLGAERESEFSRSTVESLIDARYRARNEQQTWFTTNLSLSEICTRYSQRTLSRLCEMCCLIAYDGADRRIAMAMGNAAG